MRLLQLTLILGLGLIEVRGQSIIMYGDNTASFGQSKNYEVEFRNEYNQAVVPPYGDYNWTAGSGTITSYSNTTATVTWYASGSVWYEMETYDNYYYGLISVTVPTTPSFSVTGYTYNCGNTVVAGSGTVPSGQEWYWQTSAYGTSTSNSYNSGSFTASSDNTTLYLRMHATGTGIWGDPLSIGTIKVYSSAPSSGGTIGGGGSTICSGSTPSTLTNVSSCTGCYSGGISGYQWESSPDGTTWTDISGAQGSSYSPGILTSTTYYRRRGFSSCTPAVHSNTVTVSVDAVSAGGTVSSSATSSSPASGSLTLSGYTGTIQNWEKKVDNGSWTTVSSTSATLSYSDLTSSPGVTLYSYRASVKNGVCSAASSSTAVITVNALGIPTVRDTLTCPGVLTLSGVPGSGGTGLAWYSASTGGTALASSPSSTSYTTSSLSANTDYYVATVSAGGYESLSRSKMSVTLDADLCQNWTEQIIYGFAGEPISQSRKYGDGFDKEMQSQSMDFLSGKIWVTQPLYDRQNNPSGSTLPAPIASSVFSYKADFVQNPSTAIYSAQDFDKVVTVDNNAGEVFNPRPVSSASGTLGWYYSSSNNLEPLTPTTSYPYSRTYVPEGPNPLISISAGAGDNNNTGAHYARSEKSVFDASELSHYFSLKGYFISESETPTGDHGYKTVVTDPNGKQSASYVDSDGRALASYADGKWSYQYYNDAGQLMASVAPNGVNTESTAMPDFVTSYQYDHQGRLIETTSPDEGTSRFVYSTDGKIRFSENQEQRDATPKRFSYTNYDYLGRLIESGEYESSGTTPYIFEPHSTGSPDTHSVLNIVDNTGHTGVTGFSGESRCHETNYMLYDAKAPDYPSGEQHVAQGNLIGQVSRTKNDNSTTWYSYDEFGQLAWMKQSLPLALSPTLTWSNLANVKVSNDGKTITKTSGSSLSWNAGGFSNQSIPNDRDGWIEFSFDGADIIGLSTEDGGLDWRTINFAMLKYVNGAIWIVENGTAYQPAITTVPSDIFRIERMGTTVYYKQNGTTIYTSTIASTGALFIDCSLYDGHSSLRNITMGSRVPMVTVDYTYDYFGNVTRVAYQKGQADAFYHHYHYDVNQRLTSVYTSLNGTDSVLRAKYYYYLHGPLKRVELGGNVQGIDYVYNIDGSLKFINHPDPSKDPGLDGISGSHESFRPDAFGMALDYNASDYTGAGYSGAGSFSLSGSYPDQYGGTVKASRWHSAVDNHVMRGYAYNYDNSYQLTSARWGMVSGSGSYTIDIPSGNPYKEAISGYDRNGNIQSLARNNKAGDLLADFDYHYVSGTNRLDTLRNADSTMVVYQYNSIGQMTQQTEGLNTMKVRYNAYGLTKEIRDGDDKLRVSFAYDDRGNRMNRTTYTNTEAVRQITYYVSDAAGNTLAIYEEDVAGGGALTLTEVPVYGSGRIGVFKVPSMTCFYEVSDHLGNVRDVIGEPVTDIDSATYETERASKETAVFLRYDKVKRVNSPLFNHTASDAAPDTLLYNDFNDQYTPLWAIPTTVELSLENGRLKASDPEPSSYFYMIQQTLVGHRYRVDFDIDLDGGSAITAGPYDGGMITVVTLSSNGSHYYEFTAIGTSTYLVFSNPAVGAHTVYVDNFLVRDMTPEGPLTFSERLNGSTNEKYGLAKSLSVMPGDTVNLEVYGKYVDSDDNNWTGALTTLMGQIAGNTAGVVVDGASYSTSTSSFPFTGLLSTSGSSGGPKAYLNWLIFDRNFAFVSGGYTRMSAAPAEHGQNVAHEKLSSPDIVITEPGYVYAYLSNEETTPVEVYFDDFKVTHKHSSNVAGGDYYPFGLVMNERQITQEPYRFGYQGQYAEKDSTSGWNMFDLRMYDARIGRWTTADPKKQFSSSYIGMGNNPVNGVDKDGGYFSMFSWQGSLIGAAVGAGIGLTVDKDNWGWYALGGAAAGGFLASDFAKVEIWGTHQGRGVYANSNGPGVSGRELVQKVESPLSTKFDSPLEMGVIEKPKINIGRPAASTNRDSKIELLLFKKIELPKLKGPTQIKFPTYGRIWGSWDLNMAISKFLRGNREDFNNMISSTVNQYNGFSRTHNVSQISFVGQVNLNVNKFMREFVRSLESKGIPSDLIAPQLIHGGIKGRIIIFMGGYPK